MTSSSRLDHYPLLDRVLGLKVNDAIIALLANFVRGIVKVAEETPSSTPVASEEPASEKEKQEEPSLESFMSNVIHRSRSTMSTLLVVFIYLRRLEAVIRCRSVPGKESSRHRVVFAAIMLAHKVFNDSSMVGKHWAEVSNIFKPKEILAMEREMLSLLEWDLNVSTDEVWAAATRYMVPPFIEVEGVMAKESEEGIYEGHDPLFLSDFGPITAPPIHPVFLVQEQLQTTHRYTSHHQTQSIIVDHQLRPPSVTSSPAYSSSASSCYSFGSPIPIPPNPLHRLRRASYVSFVDSPMPLAHSTRSIPPPPGLNRRPLPTSVQDATSRQQGLHNVRSVSNLPNVRISGRSKGAIIANTQPYPHLPPSARMRKKRHMSSAQPFHLPTSMHPYPAHCSIVNGSPIQSIASGSNSSANASIQSSPSNLSFGVQSPRPWPARSHLKYEIHRQPSPMSKRSAPVDATNLDASLRRQVSIRRVVREDTKRAL